MKQETNSSSYVYETGQKIEFEGNIMLLIANLLSEVVNNETSMFASHEYPINLVEVKNKDGKVIRVDYELKEHTQESFMMTAANDNGAFVGLTPLGVKAAQILSGLIWTHEQNVEKGIAKKQEILDEQRAFES